MSQHKKVMPSVKPVSTGSIVSGRFSGVTAQIPAIPSGVADHMIVCNMFDQYKLTDSAHTYSGMCLPKNYSSNTYGRNVNTGIWYKMKLSRDTFITGLLGRWYHCWKVVDISTVPRQYQTAALLLS